MGVTIGVFDSGFGGLTVLRELLPLIPGAHYIYLGDTARLPYGSKSQATIARYAVESARFLESRGAEHLVIACNTASALALGRDSRLHRASPSPVSSSPSSTPPTIATPTPTCWSSLPRQPCNRTPTACTVPDAVCTPPRRPALCSCRSSKKDG